MKVAGFSSEMQWLAELHILGLLLRILSSDRRSATAKGDPLKHLEVRKCEARHCLCPKETFQQIRAAEVRINVGQLAMPAGRILNPDLPIVLIRSLWAYGSMP